MQVFRFHTLPAVIVPNSLYFIGDDGVGLCRAYVSGHTGNLNEIEGVTDPLAFIDTITAGEALGGHRAVTAAGLHATDATLDLVIGITSGAAAQGDLAPYVEAGAMDEGSWSWTPGGPVFVGASGVLTQTEPVGALKRIGTAVTATRLAVDLQPTIYRG